VKRPGQTRPGKKARKKNNNRGNNGNNMRTKKSEENCYIKRLISHLVRFAGQL